MLGNLRMVGVMSGDFHSANSKFSEALHFARTTDNRLTQSYGLAAAGWYAANTGQARAAVQLLGAAEALGTQTGADMIGPSVPLLAQAKESAIGALGASKFMAQFTAGKQMGRHAAVRLALAESEHADIITERIEAGPLAKREAEVAKLVAQGLSNNQIGSRLLISEATVATHIRSIMNKLGVNSRTQIAGWMASSNR